MANGLEQLNHSRANYLGLRNINCAHYITKSQKIYLDNGLILRDINETRDKKICQLLIEWCKITKSMNCLFVSIFFINVY